MMNIYTDLGVSTWRSPGENFLSHKPCISYESRNLPQCFDIFQPNRNNQSRKGRRPNSGEVINRDKISQYLTKKIPGALCKKSNNIFHLGLPEVSPD